MILPGEQKMMHTEYNTVMWLPQLKHRNFKFIQSESQLDLALLLLMDGKVAQNFETNHKA